MQVMLNLLSNAAKFCAADGTGRVRITLSRMNDALQIDVADNGIGISEADQRVIFEKFRQVGDTLTAKPQGTGLGLPICRQIIDHFGGRLWVRSRSGAGATFSFVIPLAAGGAAPAASARLAGAA
jgi:signal transduction histidine kinase